MQGGEGFIAECGSLALSDVRENKSHVAGVLAVGNIVNPSSCATVGHVYVVGCFLNINS